MEAKIIFCLLLLFASTSTTTSFERDVTDTSDAAMTRRQKRDVDEAQPSPEADGEVLQRSHRDGRRLVTPDPSVNVDNFNFSASDHHDVVANASQMPRRRNLKRRLERYHRQNRGRNETSADQQNEDFRQRNSTRRRRNRRRGGLAGCGCYFFLLHMALIDQSHRFGWACFC